MRYLLDTNIVSEPLKPAPNHHVLAALEKHEGEIAIDSPVWHELHFGCMRLPNSKKRALIETFLNDVLLKNIPILPYDEKAARWHAEQRAALTAQGMSPAFVDGQIASVAKVNGLILVTRNIKDYERYTGIEFGNWFEML